MSTGFGFIAKIGDMVSRVKAGKAFMTLEAQATPLLPAPLLLQAAYVACLSSAGRLLVFNLDELKTLAGGGRGVTLIGLDAGETLLQAVAFGAAGLVLMGVGRAGKPAEATLSLAALAPFLGKRARRGRVPELKFKLVGLRPA